MRPFVLNLIDEVVSFDSTNDEIERELNTERTFLKYKISLKIMNRYRTWLLTTSLLVRFVLVGDSIRFGS
jgi:hypothetical protein